jgi:hypothetical protein
VPTADARGTSSYTSTELEFGSVTTPPVPASDQAKADVSALLKAALVQATEGLYKRGPLYPFMITISTDGYRDTSPLVRDGGALTVGADILAANLAAIRAARSEYRAIAIVLDVPGTAPDGDSISVRCEHREGLAIEADAPYTRRAFPKKVRVGALRVHQGKKLIWPEVEPE